MTRAIEPRAPIPLDPATAVLHYAQEIFEGLKAYQHGRRRRHPVPAPTPMPAASSNRPSAWRWRRCPRRCSSKPSTQLVSIDRAWIPDGEGSLYLRPFMIASEVFLGVKPSSDYIFVVIASPVGAYFKGGARRRCRSGSRRTTPAPRPAAPAPPSAAATTPRACVAQAEAIEHGCDQVVFLDAVERRYVEELGGMNVFFVFDDGSLLDAAARRHDPARHHPRTR